MAEEPKQPNPMFVLSDADIDHVLEQVKGKPVDRGSLAANIRSIEERIAGLEQERAAFERQLAVGPATANAAGHLADVQADLRHAHALLSGYRSQLGSQN